MHSHLITETNQFQCSPDRKAYQSQSLLSCPSVLQTSNTLWYTQTLKINSPTGVLQFFMAETVFCTNYTHKQLFCIPASVVKTGHSRLKQMKDNFSRPPNTSMCLPSVPLIPKWELGNRSRNEGCGQKDGPNRLRAESAVPSWKDLMRVFFYCVGVRVHDYQSKSGRD